MSIRDILRVYPTINDICEPTVRGKFKTSPKDCIKKAYHCPVQHCKYHQEDYFFGKMKFLRQHFIKVHRKLSLEKDDEEFPSDSTLRVYPTIEALCEPIKGRPKSSSKDVKKKYHCPFETCKYYKKKYFEKMKFLRQHFIKVHKKKLFNCDECGKQFSLHSTLQRHKLICGVSYRCYCNAEYHAYEALITHVKRKHQEDMHLKYKNMMQLLKIHSTALSFQKSVDNVLKLKAIIIEDLMKQKLLMLKEKKNKVASSKETQTGMKMCKILPNINSQTQTTGEENVKKTVSMQTTIEGTNRKRKRSRNYGIVSKISCTSNDISFSTSGTQTSPVKENELTVFLQNSVHSDETKRLIQTELRFLSDQKLKSSCSSELSFASSTVFQDDENTSNTSCIFAEKPLMYDPSLGSVTNFDVEENKSCAETQTDAHDVESVMNDLLKTGPNLIMCSDSETQTIFEDYFDNSYMDTYTQTCDSLFSDLDFVDIQTQTPWSLFDDTKLA